MTEVDDAHISVRFKHGIHTIYLFVDSLESFSATSKELLELLEERYPDGLTTSVDPPKTTPLPTGGGRIVYGVLNVPTDPTRGWKKLNTGDGDVKTPVKCGLKNDSIVAFTFVDGDDEEEEVLFEVEWPREDDELYEQGDADDN